MGRLYQTFPTPIELYGSDFPELSLADDDPNSIAKIDRYLRLADTYFHTAVFLLEEGYLRGEKVEGRTFLGNCTLTSKGLAALQRTPKALQGGKSSVASMFMSIGKDAAKEVTRETIRSGVKALLGGG